MGEGGGITRKCAGGVSWFLWNEGDIKPRREENYVGDGCGKIAEHIVNLNLSKTKKTLFCLFYAINRVILNFKETLSLPDTFFPDL